MKNSVGESLSSNRIDYWDVVKGVLIILVVLGHSIQFSTSIDNFWETPIYIFIYSFHMPLFMLISGYFFYYSVNRHKFGTIVFSKCCQCVVPIATISLIESLINNEFDIKAIFVRFYSSYWFLWSVLFLCLFVLIINKYVTKLLSMTYLLLYLSLFFLPDIWKLRYIAFMFPFFVVGFHINKFNLFNLEQRDENRNYYILSTLIWGAAFVFLLLFYSKDTYIYITHYTILNGGGWRQVLIDIQRTITGLCGSLFMLHFIKIIYSRMPSFIKNLLLFLGKRTLPLYIVTTTSLFVIIELHFSGNEISYSLAFIYTIVTILISTIMIEMINKYRIPRFFFFGKLTTKSK